MRTPLLLILLLAFTACSGPGPKVYDPIDKPLYQLPVKTLWVAHAGVIGERQFRQLPTVIRNGNIYLATNDGYIGVLDAKSGTLLWEGHLHEHIIAGPEVDSVQGKSDAIYVANDNAEIVALKPKTLEVIWRSRVSSEVLQAPVIAGEKLIVQSIDGKLTALSKNDGKSLWVESREVPPLTLRGTARPIIDGEVLYTGFADGSVGALSLSTGKSLWDTSIAVARGRSDVERIVDVDGIIYQDANTIYACAMQGRVAAISKSNGQLIWVRDMSAYTGVVSDGKALYIADAESRIWALDIKSGATLWRMDALKGRDVSAPAIVNGELVVGDGDGIVHWMSTAEGRLQSQVALNDIYRSAFLVFGDDSTEDRQPAVTTQPVVFNNAVYVRDNSGAFTVLTVDNPAS